MVDMLAMLAGLLHKARAQAPRRGPSAPRLHQLVLIVADGRFHERDALRAALVVRPSCAWPGVIGECMLQRGCARLVIEEHACSVLPSTCASCDFWLLCGQHHRGEAVLPVSRLGLLQVARAEGARLPANVLQHFDTTSILCKLGNACKGCDGYFAGHSTTKPALVSPCKA